MSEAQRLGLVLVEAGLLIVAVVVARIWLSHHVEANDIPNVLKQRIATLDRLHRALLVGAATLVVSGLGLTSLT